MGGLRMKNKIILLVASAALLLGYTSCSKAANEETNLWGEISYYDDFLFSEYQPDTINKKLSIELNDFAVEGMTKPLKIKIYQKTIDEKTGKASISPISTDDLLLFINGKQQNDNIIEINPKGLKANEKKTVDVGIMLSKKYLSKLEHDEITLNYIFKVEDNAGLDKINQQSIRNGLPFLDNDMATQINIQASKVANSVEVGTYTGLVIAAILFALWIIVSRFVLWGATRFSKVIITYPGQSPMVIKMQGAYQLVLTNDSNQKDSLLKKIFKGKQKFEVNSFWSHSIILKSGTSSQRLIFEGLRDYNCNGEWRRKEQIEILHPQNDTKVIIQTT